MGYGGCAPRELLRDKLDQLLDESVLLGPSGIPAEPLRSLAYQVGMATSLFVGRGEPLRMLAY